MQLQDILKLSPVVPVITIYHVEDAVPIAEALIAGGIRIFEITLRTPAGFPAIQQIVQKIPNSVVGVGTVIHPDQLLKAKDLGAQFAVSPGLTPLLLEAAQMHKMPYLPGVGSGSDIMMALQHNFNIVKPFPAELLGGTQWITAHKTVFPHLNFFPSGGVTKDSMNHYLALESVVSVGGTWLTPADAIKRKDWAAITATAQETLSLVG